MRKTFVLFAATIALVTIGTRSETSFIARANAACMAGDKIDNTTADSTKKRLQGAGYSKVTKMQKGCDNYWHADAMKDGTAVHVAVSPQGQILPDGGE